MLAAESNGIRNFEEVDVTQKNNKKDLEVSEMSNDFFFQYVCFPFRSIEISQVSETLTKRDLHWVREAHQQEAMGCPMGSGGEGTEGAGMSSKPCQVAEL